MKLFLMRILAAVLIILALFAIGSIAHSAPPAKTDPALAPWFQSLSNPNLNGMSCCAEADGRILRDDMWRIIGDGYQVYLHGDKPGRGKWIDVPPKAVLNRVDNPTGGAVVFLHTFGGNDHPTVLCFVRPVES